LERGFKECLRVLKPGGHLIFTVPIQDIPHSVRLTEITEYHGSRISGPNSVPLFWRFSKHDICQLVKGFGFASVELAPVTLCSAQGAPQLVVKAQTPLQTI
jgi:SAM-dependent methyltransferase